MATYTFTNSTGKHAQVAQHLDAMGITLISASLSGSAYTITTDLPVPEDQAEHLEMTEA